MTVNNPGKQQKARSSIGTGLLQFRRSAWNPVSRRKAGMTTGG